MTTATTHRKWYHVILFWELARILYNGLMIFVGIGSFRIGYVNIPLVYEIIGLLLNCFFTLSWIIELRAWAEVPTSYL